MTSPDTDKFTIAVRDGVTSATGQTTVVIDKTGFVGLSDLEKSQKVEAAIREQLPPEEADKFINAKIEQAKEFALMAGEDMADYMLNHLEGTGYNLYKILEKPLYDGAYSKDHSAGGVEFCSIEHTHLGDQVDDMAETISKVTGAKPEDIRKNFTADPEEHAKRTGAHEGQHCDGYAGLHGEVQADRESYKHVSPDAGLEFRDYRALTAMYGAGHATNPIVMGEQPSDNVTMEFNVGRLHSGVSRVFDYVVEDYMGVDNDTHSSDWNIDKYSQAVDEMKDDLINSANAMPDGPERTEALLVAEAVINYAEDYEDAYRRRVLGEDVPERAQVNLVSLEDKANFYENHFDSSGYTKEKTGELHTRIKENIEKYSDADNSTAALGQDDDWDLGGNPADLIGNSIVAMEGSQNNVNLANEVETQRADIQQVKSADFTA